MRSGNLTRAVLPEETSPTQNIPPPSLPDVCRLRTNGIRPLWHNYFLDSNLRNERLSGDLVGMWIA
jgi:hypothetical protein